MMIILICVYLCEVQHVLFGPQRHSSLTASYNKYSGLEST